MLLRGHEWLMQRTNTFSGIYSIFFSVYYTAINNNIIIPFMYLSTKRFKFTCSLLHSAKHYWFLGSPWSTPNYSLNNVSVHHITSYNCTQRRTQRRTQGKYLKWLSMWVTHYTAWVECCVIQTLYMWSAVSSRYCVCVVLCHPNKLCVERCVTQTLYAWLLWLNVRVHGEHTMILKPVWIKLSVECWPPRNKNVWGDQTCEKCASIPLGHCCHLSTQNYSRQRVKTHLITYAHKNPVIRWQWNVCTARAILER